MVTKLITQDVLAELWDSLDSEIIPVLDEDGVQMANGQMRWLPRKYGSACALYVDDVDGYEVISPDDARRLGALNVSSDLLLS